LHKDEPILEECLTGEKYTLEEYGKVLEHKDQLPPIVVSRHQSQKDEIQSTVNEITSLENAAYEHHL
jgi:hypothetical protein